MGWRPCVSESARDRPLSLSAAERYVELALRLAKHEPELVFGYSGPRELADRVDAEDPVPPSTLARRAEDLLDELRAADDGRARWLAAQTDGLLVLAERLAGREIPYREDVERSYGVAPE